MKTLLITVKEYVEQRDKLISDVVNLTKIVYPRDREMLSGVINITNSLLLSDPDQEFIDGIRGFMLYADMAQIKPSTALTTLIHDLGEFSRNRHEPWFSPRTSRYNKYLTGASEAII